MMSFEVCHTPCEERDLNIIQNREPGKQGEALEHDGDVWPALTQRFIMPKDFAAGGWCESGEDSQKGGFATPRRAEKGHNRVGLHRQSACESYALLHASREFFGVRRLKTL